MAEPCCEIMSQQLNKTCEQHKDPFDCDGTVVGPPVMKNWGLPVPDGSHSYIQIKFCPFCGEKLP